MKRSLFIAIVVLLMAALFVSCNADKAVEDQLFEVTIDGGARTLQVSGTSTAPEVEQLFWYYSAHKVSGLFRTGETSWKAVQSTAGISGASLGSFSKGDWTFCFYGFTEPQDATEENPLTNPKATAVYYQEALGQNISQAVVLNITLTKGTLAEATIGFVADGITWTYAKAGAGLNLEMEILDGNTLINFGTETNPITRLAGTDVEGSAGSYVFKLNGSLALDAGPHDFKVKVYYIEGTTEELVGETPITITAIDGMQYLVSGSVDLTDELKDVSIGGADAPVTAVAPVEVQSTGATEVETDNTPIGTTGTKTTVSFPEGALAADTTITVETSASASQANNAFVIDAGDDVKGSISLSLESGDTTFNNKEVTVTTFIAKNLLDVHVYYNVAGDTTDYKVSYDPSTGELVFKTTHFSEYVVIGKDAVAQIEDQVFASLMDAIDSVEKYGYAEITLLRDVTDGTGLSTDSRNADNYPKDLVIDFNGKTYTMKDPAVGSTGTQTQAMHWADNSTIVLKNGTFKVQEDAVNVKQAMQNYAYLTIENMTVDLRAVPQCYYGENEFSGVWAVYNGMPCPVFNVVRGSMTIKDSTITLNSACGNYGICVSAFLSITNSTINTGIVLDEIDAMVVKKDGTTVISNGVHSYFAEGYTLYYSDEPAYGYDPEAEMWALCEEMDPEGGPYAAPVWPMLVDEGEW